MLDEIYPQDISDMRWFIGIGYCFIASCMRRFVCRCYHPPLEAADLWGYSGLDIHWSKLGNLYL